MLERVAVEDMAEVADGCGVTEGTLLAAAEELWDALEKCEPLGHREAVLKAEAGGVKLPPPLALAEAVGEALSLGDIEPHPLAEAQPEALCVTRKLRVAAPLLLAAVVLVAPGVALETIDALLLMEAHTVELCEARRLTEARALPLAERLGVLLCEALAQAGALPLAAGEPLICHVGGAVLLAAARKDTEAPRLPEA